MEAHPLFFVFSKNIIYLAAEKEILFNTFNFNFFTQMKKILLLTAAALLFFSGCKNDDSKDVEPQPQQEKEKPAPKKAPAKEPAAKKETK